MNISLKTGFFLFLGVGLFFGGAIILHFHEKNQWEDRLRAANNVIAAHSATIEVTQGVYEKNAEQIENLNKTLVSKDKQTKDLKAQLDKSHSELLTYNELVIKLKKDLEYHIKNVKQTTVIDPQTQKERQKVEFSQNIGTLYNVSGYTMTNPGEAFLKYSQIQPLKLNLGVSQDKSGKWSTWVTSNDPTLELKIGLAEVNPQFFKPHWYEKIGLALSLAGGDINNKPNFLGGIGITYSWGKFTLGPQFWLSSDGNLGGRFYGLLFIFQPFRKTQ